MEFFVLEQMKKEIGPRTNQYGGVSGCGTTHYLLQAWHEILEAMEDDGAAVSLISIDFAKAFNTMGHQSCIKAVLDHGASVHMARLVSSFLYNRQMRFKIEGTHSTPRLLRGGSPQGTLLGNFIFIITTDKLEDTNARPIVIDRTGSWDPDTILHAENLIQRRPSAIAPGLHGVVTSSPARGRHLPFNPDLDDLIDRNHTEENSTFRFFRGAND